MDIKNQIEQDIKVSMISGDKQMTMALKNIKSAVQYAQVDNGGELSKDQIIGLLIKEQKKRKESADMYAKGGNTDKQQAELYEVDVIAKYLPQAMSEEDISKLIDETINTLGDASQAQMGQIIGQVKAKAGPSADGAVIAKLVKERLQ